MARHYATIISLLRTVPICKTMSTPNNVPNMKKVSQTLTLERHHSLFNSRDQCGCMIALSTAENMSFKGSLMGRFLGRRIACPMTKRLKVASRYYTA